MRDETLHAAVLAAPDDDGPRQVYADWLIEHGDPRGELINVQVARARLPKGDPRDRTLADHENLLWSKHHEQWQQPWMPDSNAPGYWPTYARGFVEQISCESSVLPEALIARPQLLEDSCVRSLRISNVELPTIERLLPAIERRLPLSRLRTLSITMPLHAGSLGRALASPAFAELEELRLLQLGDWPLPIEAIVGSRLPRLRVLGLDRAQLSPDAVRLLAGWTTPPPLRELALSQSQVSGALETLLASPLTRSLERLILTRASLVDTDAMAIAAAGRPLLELDLTDNDLGPPAAAAIAATSSFVGLRWLRLVGTRIGRAGFDALAGSPHLSIELTLTVDGSVVGLRPDIWFDQDVVTGSSWQGKPSAADAARFRLDLPPPRA